MPKKFTIDFFCHVIDYFGDVAVGLRLAKAIKKCRPNYRIRFFCDSFSTIATLTNFNSNKDKTIEGVELYPFNSEQEIANNHVAIEVLSCDLPSWYKAKNIINLEYLTAESWAKDFHLQNSLVGGNIKKKFFLGGFYHGTGGLVSNYANILTKEQFFQEHNLKLDCNKPCVSLYMYQIDFDSIDRLDNYQFIALGSYNQPYPANFYPIKLTMNQYDSLVNLADFNLVRGEDSLSRALLSGKPFFWQAYRQAEEAHFDKINALLTFIEPYLTYTTFKLYQAHFLQFNKDGALASDFFTNQALYQELTIAMNQIQTYFARIGYQEEHLVNLLEKEFSSIL